MKVVIAGGDKSSLVIFAYFTDRVQHFFVAPEYVVFGNLVYFTFFTALLDTNEQIGSNSDQNDR